MNSILAEDEDVAADSFVVLGEDMTESNGHDFPTGMSLVNACRHNNSPGAICTDCHHSMVQLSCENNINDENSLLRRALKENNNIMRDQFDKIQKWRSDVMETHRLHKIKFEETKELIKKLKIENTQLKRELEDVKISEIAQQNMEDVISFANHTSLDGRINDLDNANRRIIEENAKLLSEKDELQKIINALKIQMNRVDEDRTNSISEYEKTLSDLTQKLTISNEKLLLSENLKIDHANYKQTTEQTINSLQVQIKELKSKFKDALILTLQSSSNNSHQSMNSSPEYKQLNENAKVYDATLRGIATDVNFYVEQLFNLSNHVTKLLNILNSHKPEEHNKEEVESIKIYVEKLHQDIVEHNNKIKGHVSSLGCVFEDYKNAIVIGEQARIYQETNMQYENKILELEGYLLEQKDTIDSQVKEITNLRELAKTLQLDSDNRDHMKAQLEIYKSDFEMEREERTRLASDKNQIEVQLDILQRENQRLRRLDSTSSEQHMSTGPVDEHEMTPPPVPYMCPLCDNTFRNSTLLQNHVDVCLDNNGQ